MYTVPVNCTHILCWSFISCRALYFTLFVDFFSAEESLICQILPTIMYIVLVFQITKYPVL